MKKKTVYICNNCNYESVGYMGKCPVCNTWNSLVETTIVNKKDSKISKREVLEKKTVRRLGDVESTNSHRIVTSINEFNRVMGEGLLKIL